MADIPTTVMPNIPPSIIEMEVNSAPPGRYRVLAWSGAEAGVGNAITGYQVYRSTSEDGEYTALIKVSSTETSGSVQVVAPTENGDKYYYKVATLGEVTGFDSELSSVSTYLICDTSILGEPTDLSINPTNAGPGAEATLSWSGAAHGYHSTTGSTTLAKQIDGYRVYRSTLPDAGYTLLMEVETGETFGSATVTAPEDNGETYYYRVRPGLKPAGAQFPGQIVPADDTVMSRAIAALTCTYSTTSAPTQVTVNGSKAEYYALPGEFVTLAWSEATPGANNGVAGYKILRDGEVYAEDLSPDVTSYAVPAHDTAGHMYAYSVVTLGEQGESAPSSEVKVYTYSEPEAPQTVTVSAAEVAPGSRIRLSWADAAPGGYNEIIGYRVYRAETVNGAQTLVSSVDSTETSASCYVDAPFRDGEEYYFRVATAGSYSVGSISGAYATVKASDGAGDGGGSAGEGDGTTVIIKPPTWQKRKLIIGDYDTALDGWTLASLSFAEPEPVTNYVNIPWRADGPLDASDAPTNGDPRFGSRSLVATLELSEGTRDERNEIISRMTNRLHGWRKQIVLPDDPTRYVVGRVKVRKLYSDLAHAAVEITAVCEPWRYKTTETRLELLVPEDVSTVVLGNSGRKVLVPEITVTGRNARVELSTGDFAWTLTPGVYRLPDLRLLTGDTLLTYSGSGLVMIKYREAIL